MQTQMQMQDRQEAHLEGGVSEPQPLLSQTRKLLRSGGQMWGYIPILLLHSFIDGGSQSRAKRIWEGQPGLR